MTVPEGTIEDVLAWVGDDPARAREALEEERAGQNRSTLVSKLEAIASREESTVSDTDTTEEPDVIPEPEEAEPSVNPADVGSVTQPLVRANPEVEVEESDDLGYEAAQAEEGDPPDPIEGEIVESFQVASNSRSTAVSLNGTVFLLNRQMAAALKQSLDKAVTGLNL